MIPDFALDYFAFLACVQGEGRVFHCFLGQVPAREPAQLAAGDRYLSAPVEVVFEEANPARSAAEVTFRQVRPLN